MALLDIKNVEISGVAACVPAAKDCISEVYKWGGVDSFLNNTGIRNRRRANDTTTSADLCMAAAEKLIEELNWSKDEIEALVFVTQTPDFILPATSAVLQQKLGLSTGCLALDISLGCSGWVYSLSVIASLMQNGTIKKGLLLAGDTITKLCSPDDKSTFPLFGDAGTATALTYTTTAAPMHFILNTDGSGESAIMIKDGGYRYMFNEESMLPKEISEGICRSDLNLVLDGMDVFSFGITKAPKSVKQLAEHFDINLESVDLFTFHQANRMMNEQIRKKLKLPEQKVPYSLDEYANTSCASIPLTLVTREAERLRTEKVKHIACGFGVGLSWGSAYFVTDRITIPQLIEL